MGRDWSKRIRTGNVYCPDLELPSTSGSSVNVRRHVGRAVVFVYPYTGREGYADPEGWDNIPGAHGSTPQALAYKKLHPRFKALGVAVFGMSYQDTEWQQEFAERNELPYVLLSDAKGHVASKLSLKTFMAGGQAFLRRRTLVFHNGKVILDRKQIADPSHDAAEVLAWLEKQ